MPRTFQLGVEGASAGTADRTGNISQPFDRVLAEIASEDEAHEKIGGLIRLRFVQRTVSWRLKALAGAPVVIRKQIFVLKYKADHGGGKFAIETPSQMGNL